MPRKQDPKVRPGTAAYYESRRGDLSEWSTEPARAKVTATGTVVVSIRMDVGEVEAVRRAAHDYGMTVSELVRSALLQSAYSRPQVTVGSAQYTCSAVGGVVQATDSNQLYRSATVGTQGVRP